MMHGYRKIRYVSVQCSLILEADTLKDCRLCTVLLHLLCVIHISLKNQDKAMSLG